MARCRGSPILLGRRWCRHHGIRHRFSALGKYGSLAVIERGILTIKNGRTRRLSVVPFRLALIEHESEFLVPVFHPTRTSLPPDQAGSAFASCLSGPFWCSLTLRPANLQTASRRLLSPRLRPLRCLHDRWDSYPTGTTVGTGLSPRGFRTPLASGASGTSIGAIPSRGKPERLRQPVCPRLFFRGNHRFGPHRA